MCFSNNEGYPEEKLILPKGTMVANGFAVASHICLLSINDDTTLLWHMRLGHAKNIAL